MYSCRTSGKTLSFTAVCRSICWDRAANSKVSVQAERDGLDL